jgi:integral membrane protein (TIGR01906 family)
VLSAIVGILLAALVAGVALMPLTSAVASRLLVGATASVSSARLGQERTLKLAEEARAFVMGGTAELTPDAQQGSGFDDASISHLRDVRRVLSGVRVASGVLAALLAVWLGAEVARRRFTSIALGLRAGAVACVVLVVAVGLIALLDFDSFFAGFHSIFFEPGTWTFPAGTLLIELFPERFWQAMGVGWGVLILLGGAALAAASRAVAGAPGGPESPTAPAS